MFLFHDLGEILTLKLTLTYSFIFTFAGCVPVHDLLPEECFQYLNYHDADSSHLLGHGYSALYGKLRRTNGTKEIVEIYQGRVQEFKSSNTETNRLL